MSLFGYLTYLLDDGQADRIRNSDAERSNSVVKDGYTFHLFHFFHIFVFVHFKICQLYTLLTLSFDSYFYTVQTCQLFLPTKLGQIIWMESNLFLEEGKEVQIQFPMWSRSRVEGRCLPFLVESTPALTRATRILSKVPDKTECSGGGEDEMSNSHIADGDEGEEEIERMYGDTKFYCPVTLATKHQLIPGDPKHTVRWKV